MKNKGYFFTDYFDITCYLIITIIYPLITIFEQIRQPVEGVVIRFDFYSTGLFFVAAFFYDYYQRYRDCEEQTETVVNILFWGRLGFGILSIFSILFFILLACNSFPGIHGLINIFFDLLPWTALYPLVVALGELKKRMICEKKGKIGAVGV